MVEYVTAVVSEKHFGVFLSWCSQSKDRAVCWSVYLKGPESLLYIIYPLLISPDFQLQMKKVVVFASFALFIQG